MRCPTCGSPEVYRSKQRAFKRMFNWVFWYKQRPYRCATCMTRYWTKLEPRAWRHTLKLRASRLARTWGLYLSADQKERVWKYFQEHQGELPVGN